MQSENQISITEKIISVSNSIQQKPDYKIRQELIYLINELINKDFSSLLQLLYRIDVDEKKIRIFLNENTSEDSACIIADLIIERQLKKIESRKLFSKNKNNESEEEKW